MKKILEPICIICGCCLFNLQLLKAQDSLSWRPWLVAAGHAGIWTATYIALDKAWYDGYDKTKFHVFNDGGEWNQMDKAGHLWTSYQLSRISGATWRWAGLKEKNAVLLGAASAVAYQSIIEIQDGYSSKWGFSWEDMGANIAGAGIYMAQQFGWKEQRIQVKMGYWPRQYPSAIIHRRDELFGSGSVEKILKDYNSQTYWLSANLHSFVPAAKIPKWLNISLGYSSDLMLGGRENIWIDDEGLLHDYSYITRTRRYYLSADIDLTRISTRSKFLNTLFFCFNAIKIPAPALEFNSEGKFRFHVLHQ